MHVLADAIKTAKSTEADAIRKAHPRAEGYKGVEGTYSFDKNGDGLHGYNIVKNENGKVTFVKHIDIHGSERGGSRSASPRQARTIDRGRTERVDALANNLQVLFRASPWAASMRWWRWASCSSSARPTW